MAQPRTFYSHDLIDVQDTKSFVQLNRLYARLAAVRQMERYLRRQIDNETVRLAREVGNK